MEITGIVRKVDELGRVVLPKEMRGVLGVEVGDQVDIVIQGSSFVVTPVKSKCVFCNKENKNMNPYEGKMTCHGCLSKLNKAKKRAPQSKMTETSASKIVPLDDTTVGARNQIKYEYSFVKVNYKDKGEEYAEEVRRDAQLTLAAIYHVAEFASDKCRIIVED